MAEQIKVSVSSMGRDTASLHEQMNRIKQEIAALQSAMHRLSACWEGPAWEAFQGQVQDGIAYMQDINQWVQSYIGIMDDSAKRYQSCEQTVYGRVSSLRI